MKKLEVILILGILISFKSLSAQQQQPYYFNKILKGSFEEITEKLKSELKTQGFGVMTEIDMHTTLKEKLPDVDIEDYKILGICNPGFAFKTLQIDENIGLFLPCKAIIKDVGDGKIEVAIVDPTVIMSILEKEELVEIAEEVSEKFKSALNNLETNH